MMMEKKQELITNTCMAINKMTLSSDAYPEGHDMSADLVPLVEGHIADRKHHTPTLYRKPDIVSETTSDSQQYTQMCTQVEFAKSQSPLARPQSHTTKLEVCDTWLRLLYPESFIVGVKVVNSLSSSVENLHICLVNESCSTSYHDMIYHSKALYISRASQDPLPNFSEPKNKRCRTQPPVKTQSINTLEPGKVCYVVCQTSIPSFENSSKQTYTVLLRWNRVAITTDDVSNDVSCAGNQCSSILTLTAEDVCHSGSSWLDLNLMIQSDEVNIPAVLSLEVTQQTRTCSVQSLFTNICEDLHKAILSLGLLYCAHLQCYMCVNVGQLHGVRIQYEPDGIHCLLMHVSTRDDGQFCLLIHALYAKLADDVMITSTNKKDRSKAVHISRQCVYEELNWTESELKNLMQSKHPSKLVEICGDVTSTRVAFEQQSNELIQRDQASVDQTKLNEFLSSRAKLREKTDKTVYNMVTILNI